MYISKEFMLQALDAERLIFRPLHRDITAHCTSMIPLVPRRSGWFVYGAYKKTFINQMGWPHHLLS